MSTGASPTGAETPSKQKPSLPRGPSKGAPGGRSGEAESYYGVSPGHPLTSSYMTPNGGIQNASVTGIGGGGGGGVSGNYNPAFQSTYPSPGVPYPAPTDMPFVPGSSVYNPVPVPQASPFHGNLSATPVGPSTPGDTHNIQDPQGESASYYGAPQTGTSVASSSGSTVQHQHTSSGFGHSLESTITDITNVVQGHPHNHNHNHNHNGPPPPLRQSVRKLWENIRAEERYAVGQFEIYSESIGVCSECFEPGSSAVQAPRKHHYGQRLTKNGWRTKSKTSRRVWFFRRKDSLTYSSSEGTSSESTTGMSDSDLSETIRERRISEKRLRREKKDLRRREQQELREKEGYTSRHRRGSSSSHTKISTTHSGGLLRGGDLDKSVESKSYYNPGYGADGLAHPTYYPGSSTHEKKQVSKSSGSVLGSWFGSTNRNRKHKRVSSQVSKASSNNSLQGEPLQFSTKSSGAAASSDALVYGRYSSSPSSLGSKKGWGFRLARKQQVGKGGKQGKGEKKKEQKGKKVKGKSSPSLSSGSRSSSSPSLDGLVYGRVYESHKGTSVDSASGKSKQSNVGSVSGSIKSAGSSVFEFGKVQRRRSWDDFGTPGSNGRPGSAVVGFDPTRHSSTGGSKTVTESFSASQVGSAAASNSSWWGSKTKKSDSNLVQAGSTTYSRTSSGWGWFGGRPAQKTRSMSMSSMESGVGMGDNVQDQYVSTTTGGGATRYSGIEASAAGAKSYSSTDMAGSIRKGKDNEIFMQRRNSESRIFTSTSGTGRKVKEEIWAHDPVRRERSPDRSSITTTGSRRRASSVDSYESDSRQPQTQYQKNSTQVSASTTTRTGFLGLFSGRSEGRREESKSDSKESGRRLVKTVELKGSKKEKTGSSATKDKRMVSTTYVVGTPGEEENTKLQKIHHMVCGSILLSSS